MPAGEVVCRGHAVAPSSPPATAPVAPAGNCPVVGPRGCRQRMWPSEEKAEIIRVSRPTIHPGKESEFESFLF